MTRKDYVAIAAAIKAVRVDIASTNDGDKLFHMLDANTLSAFKIADAMAADNGRFSRSRFLKACGVRTHQDAGRSTLHD